MKRKVALLLALTLSLSLMTSCSPASETEENPSGGGTASVSSGLNADGSARTDLNLQLYVDPTNLDPTISASSLDMGIMYQIYDNLWEIRNGDYDDIQPALCESYETNEDMTEYTLHIRQNVLWHNGDTLTAEDVVYSINRIRTSPVTQARVSFIENVEQIDDYTVKISMSLPCPRLPALFSTASMAIVNKRVVEEYGEGTPEMVVGTGAYKVESWTPGQGLVLTAFNEGWRGAPKIQKVNYTVMTDSTAARIAFQSGSLDMYTANTIDDYNLFSTDEAIRTEKYTLATTDALVFNTTRSILSDENFRKAVAHAIDSEALAVAVNGGLYTPADSIIPQGCQGYTEDVPKYEYDPDKAQEYLAQSAYAGEAVKLLYTSSSNTSVAWATTIQAFLNAVGINVEMEGQDYSNVVQRVGTRDYDMVLFEYGMNFAMPVSSFYALFSSEGYYNVFQWFDDDVDKAIEEAYATVDEDVQTQLLTDINIEALENCLYVPSYHLGGYYFYPQAFKTTDAHEPAFGWIKLCYAYWDV